MFGGQVVWWELIVRSCAIYLALVVCLRLFGKREVGQFTLFDLVFILLVANAVQPAMTGPDTSLGGGLIIIASLIVLNRVIAALREVRVLRPLFDQAPTKLAVDGKWLTENLKREGLDEEDCEMALREHGLDNVGQVRLVMLEPDGNISVVPLQSGIQGQVRRRMRIVRHR